MDYPRPCGGSLNQPPLCVQRIGLSPPVRGIPPTIAIIRPCIGLSPPMRGILVKPLECLPRRGTTPAPAGNPRPLCDLCAVGAVYPRPHGEPALPDSANRELPGLPPPTRGTHPGNAVDFVGVRPTPAHTGNPAPAARQWYQTQVYPRPRGETDYPFFDGWGWYGLPPPTRGTPSIAVSPNNRPWSTPAHARNPQSIPSPLPKSCTNSAATGAAAER